MNMVMMHDALVLQVHVKLIQLTSSLAYFHYPPLLLEFFVTANIILKKTGWHEKMSWLIIYLFHTAHVKNAGGHPCLLQVSSDAGFSTGEDESILGNVVQAKFLILAGTLPPQFFRRPSKLLKCWKMPVIMIIRRLTREVRLYLQFGAFLFQLFMIPNYCFLSTHVSLVSIQL